RKRNYSHHRKTQSRSNFSKTSRSATWRAGIFWSELARIWMRGNVECRVRINDAGTGARRFRFAKFCFRARRSGDVSDLYVREPRGERQVAATFAARQSDRMFRIDGAAVWIESRRDADARGKERQQICFEWREDVDYQRVDRGRGSGVGENRGRQDSRI